MLNPLRYAGHVILSKKGRITCKTSGPLFLNIAVTYRCNSRCRMCNIWKVYRERPGDIASELSLDDYENFFVSNRRNLKNLFHVGITGGEPFLRDCIPELASLISKEYPNALIDISSNGMLPEKIKESVEEIYRKSPDIKLLLNIAIDGIDKLHDRIRGVANAFKKVVKTCNFLMEMKKTYGSLDVTISFTITPENYNRIYEVYKLSEKHGFRFTSRPAQQSENYYGDNTSMENVFSENMIESIEEQVRKIPGDYRGFFIRHIPEYLKDKKRHFIPCYSGFYSAFIDPYGNVFPCLYLNEKIGNIKDGKFFKERWNSEQVVGIRRKIRRKQCPNCWSECETNSSLYLDGIRFIYWNLLGRYL